MVLENTEKQGYEEYTIWGDFREVLASEEELATSGHSVSAVDSEGTDATAEVLDIGTLTVVNSPTDGTTNSALAVLVKGGIDREKYKITFKGVTNSTPAHKWEIDLYLKIKEL